MWGFTQFDLLWGMYHMVFSVLGVLRSMSTYMSSRVKSERDWLCGGSRNSYHGVSSPGRTSKHEHVYERKACDHLEYSFFGRAACFDTGNNGASRTIVAGRNCLFADWCASSMPSTREPSFRLVMMKVPAAQFRKSLAAPAE